MYTNDAATVNTLDKEEERILIQLVVAHLIQNKGIDVTDEATIGADSVVNFQREGNRREKQAIQDLKDIAPRRIVEDWSRAK